MLKETNPAIFNNNIEMISDSEMAMFAVQMNDLEPSTTSNAPFFNMSHFLDATLSIHIGLFFITLLAITIAFLWSAAPISLFRKLSR